jgi:apolipoprotein N-acyltransferase
MSLVMILTLSLFSGLLMDMALRLEGMGYLAWVALIPVLYLLEHLPKKRLAALAMAVSGLPLALWVYEGGFYEFALWTSLGCGVFVGVYGLLGVYAVHLRQRFGSTAMWLGLIAAWSGLMFLFMQPSLLHNMAHIGWAAMSATAEGTLLLPAATWSGATGLGILLWSINLGLYQVGKLKLTSLGWLLGVCALLGIALGFAPKTQATGFSSQIGIVQAPYSQADMLLTGFNDGLQTSYFGTLLELSQNPNGLLIFPEQTLPKTLNLDAPMPAPVKTFLAKLPESILGVVTTTQNQVFNTAQHWNNRALKQVYVKQALMPGGEDDLSAGDSSQPVKAAGIQWGMLICYESIVPWVARDSVLSGADALMVLTSDGFAGGANTPVAHWRGSVVLATALGRSLVFASKTGPSAVSDSSGRILAVTSRGTSTRLEASVPSASGQTLYAQYGDWLGLLGLLLSMGLLVLSGVLAARDSSSRTTKAIFKRLSRETVLK